MNMGSENYMILVKNEEQLHKLFPNFKEISRTDEGFIIKGDSCGVKSVAVPIFFYSSSPLSPIFLPNVDILI